MAIYSQICVLEPQPNYLVIGPGELCLLAFGSENQSFSRPRIHVLWIWRNSVVVILQGIVVHALVKKFSAFIDQSGYIVPIQISGIVEGRYVRPSELSGLLVWLKMPTTEAI